MEISILKRTAPSIALAMSFSVLTACAGGTSGSDAASKACEGGTTCGNLDDVQSVIGEAIGGQLAATLPAPLGPVVGCTSDTVNNIVDVPDALISGLEGLAATQDPEVLLAAFNDMGESFGNAAYNLQGALTTLAGSESNCDVNGGGSSTALPEVPGLPTGGVGDGPTGTPVDLTLTPLTDGLATLVNTLKGAAEGTPAGAAIDPIVEGLDALLAVLNGGSTSQIPDLPALPGGEANPLNELLVSLQSQLDGFSVGPGSIPGLPGIPAIPGGGSTDPDLVPVADVLTSVTDAISMAIGQGRAALEDAAGSEVPVIGGLLLTLEIALNDTSTLLDAVGSYEAVQTYYAIEGLLENVLDNALTQVIPLEFIGDQTGQDLAGPVRDGIAQGVVAVRSSAGMALGPALQTAFGDTASPALDPIESVLAQLLAASPVDLGDTLSGGIDQFVAALTDLTGGAGALPGAGDLPALPGAGGLPALPGAGDLPAIPGAGGNPLDALLGGLPAVGGDLPAGDGPTGTPADLLLGALVDNDPSGQLAGLLGQISGPLAGLLAQLQALAP